ncbi:hypothetical protein BKA70DRAFT_1448776 [Coprinopsis sp. MPI-PUGE-AT-0042]|nr:hypothetical protein BKA70DRAFT_1448776 [Coprinopsis sp. MPI-PUGE-AT-0042]
MQLDYPLQDRHINIGLSLFGIMASEVILAMMVYVLAGGRLVFGWILSVQMLVLLAAVCAMWGILLESLCFGEQEPPFPRGCFVTGGRPLFAGIAYIVLAANELVLMVITLGIGFYHYRPRHSSSSLFETLYREGMMYYVCLSGEVVVILAGPAIEPGYIDILTT